MLAVFSFFSQVARRIKILCPDSAFFEVSAPRLSNGDHLKQSKIAAGMEVMFIIKFKAQDVRDYSCDLVCSTEREKFLVPIRAIGIRPRVTFPDDIDFGTIPVKSSVSKMMFVQNVGLSTAKFFLKTRDLIFTCRAEEFIIEPGQSQMIEVSFMPSSSQFFERDIAVEFIKGAKYFIRATGSGTNVDVSLSTPSLALDCCYISLTSTKTLRVINHSDAPISFSWKSFANPEEDDIERQRLMKEIWYMRDIEMNSFLENVRNGDFSGMGIDGDGYVSDDSLGDEDIVMPFAARAAKGALIR
jgi:hydrocephalus-inducing protein